MNRTAYICPICARKILFDKMGNDLACPECGAVFGKAVLEKCKVVILSDDGKENHEISKPHLAELILKTVIIALSVVSVGFGLLFLGCVYAIGR